MTCNCEKKKTFVFALVLSASPVLCSNVFDYHAIVIFMLYSCYRMVVRITVRLGGLGNVAHSSGNLLHLFLMLISWSIIGYILSPPKLEISESSSWFSNFYLYLLLHTSLTGTVASPHYPKPCVFWCHPTIPHKPCGCSWTGVVVCDGGCAFRQHPAVWWLGGGPPLDWGYMGTETDCEREHSSVHVAN